MISRQALLDGERKRLELSIDMTFEDETLAVMIGTVEAKMEAVELDATGTYLFVLRPGDDGWRIVTDMWRQHAS